MGRQAKGMKRDNGIGGFVDKGGSSRAKSASLKFASQATKKEVTPPRYMELRLSGRRRKRHVIGSIARLLRALPVGKTLAIVWQ